MTGFVGGALDAATLDACAAELHHGDWYESAARSTGRFGVSVLHHGARDPEGCTVWEDGPRVGAIYGAVTN
ncbi:asparagine synthase, partial [Halorubrum sp. Atlit-28R]